MIDAAQEALSRINYENSENESGQCDMITTKDDNIEKDVVVPGNEGEINSDDESLTEVVIDRESSDDEDETKVDQLDGEAMLEEGAVE
uniref:Uncharacterized protein n=1 Tax=Romanomermis culicivorax TaxID=13658 RepID=A0A915J3X3_ROMCU